MVSDNIAAIYTITLQNGYAFRIVGRSPGFYACHNAVIQAIEINGEKVLRDMGDERYKAYLVNYLLYAEFKCIIA